MSRFESSYEGWRQREWRWGTVIGAVQKRLSDNLLAINQRLPVSQQSVIRYESPIGFNVWWASLTIFSKIDFESKFGLQIITPFVLVNNTLSAGKISQWTWIKWLRIGESIDLWRDFALLQQKWFLLPQGLHGIWINIQDDFTLAFVNWNAAKVWANEWRVQANNLSQSERIDFKNFSNFPELFSYIRRLGKIVNSQWTVYESEDIIQNIQQVFNGSWDITTITTTHGLRQAVSFLINNNRVKVNPILQELWPEWLHYRMKQWEAWNCYFVWALYAFKQNPSAADLLSKMIKPVNGGWMVTFFWVKDPMWRPQSTMIYQQEIDQMQKRRIDWSLWDNILERAYWRLRANLLVKSEASLSKIWHTLAIRTDKWKTAHYNWTFKEVLTYLLGDKVEGIEELKFNFGGDNYLSHLQASEWGSAMLWVPSLQKKEIAALFQNWNDQQKRQIRQLLSKNWLLRGDAGIRWYLTDNSLRSDEYKYSHTDIYWNPVEIYFNHQYIIWGINTQQWWAEIVNPHDTYKKSFKVRISDLSILFYRLDYAKLA